ncbi:ATP-dependent zinc metalloprotease FTSH 1, putative [Plasmodium relictum]|uniref:ATP-dependent zinc metalloprotease FTSH 1, putative n=1 Tax=Plasmodium relictum TaxID=85471 RepID=A0A1J1HCZ4_PLARL|nr:ATP-dependent zinc metalloprotease FTSH 1, putative [Plasmodium relictum]CRH02824.1 ATP-dependent zinc metalloprotease FTSH 1, putative [Plasmodium relictum]
MSSKYENESFLSTGSNKYYEREDSVLLHNDEDEYMNNRRVNKYNYERKMKYHEQNFNKRRNKKWNYFIIFFLGICFGFAIWPFFMTIITYKLFYTDNYNNSNYKTNNSSASLKDYGNEKNKKNDTKVTMKDQSKKSISPHFKPIKFDEIAGIDESKLELLEVVDFIKNREKYHQMGARMPKGVLLVGPPGSGKTMLARAVATEANVPYIYTSGPEFIEIYVGQGAKRIRQLFAHARSVAPSIVFIDEIDAIGGKRSSGSLNGAGQREHDQTLNQLLVEMDGFSNSVHIMVIGATNRIDTLDSALLRPGRFDRIVYVPLPDINGRKRILEIYIKKIKSDLKEEDIEKIARLTPGFSGADLENVVNEATILATRNKKSLVTINELFEARDKVSMGPERKSLRQSEHQRRITAYHEAGHAIVAYFLHPKTDPIHKATIISRGNALGYVEQIPIDDRHNYFKSQMEAKLAVCMGGRTAEEIVFGKSETSSGASSDISRATEIAYKMVTEWGMSDKLGPLNYKKRMGDGYSSNRLSAQTISTIETEVKHFVEKGKSLSEEILRKHRKELDNLAFALLDKETLSGEEIKNIIDPNNSKDYSNNIPNLSNNTKKDQTTNDNNNKNENNFFINNDQNTNNFIKKSTQTKENNIENKKNIQHIGNQDCISSKNDKVHTNECSNANENEINKNKGIEDRNDEISNINENLNNVIKKNDLKSNHKILNESKHSKVFSENSYNENIELKNNEKNYSNENLIITYNNNEIMNKNTNKDELKNIGKNEEKDEKHSVRNDKSKVDNIKEHAKKNIRNLKKKYSKDPNKKKKNILKIINEHNSYNKDKEVDNEKVESNKKESENLNQSNSRNFIPKNNNNIVKNINELYESSLFEDKHNDNDGFVKTKEQAFDNFNELIDISHIKNIDEMKKFNIFEHNLNKLFLFDIFNN